MRSRSHTLALRASAIGIVAFQGLAYAGYEPLASDLRGPKHVAGIRPVVNPSHGRLTGAHSFAPFNKTVDNLVAVSGLDPESQALTGAPAGSYNAYSVSVNWSAIAGDPWSSEAIWAFTDTNDLNTVGTFYADPGSALNSANSGSPVTLTWTGYMATSYVSPNPLYMLMGQTFSGSSAQWNNVSVTIGTAPQNITNFSGDTTGAPTWNRPFADFSGLSGVGTATPYEVIPFHVDQTTTYQIVNNYDAFDGFLLLYEDSFSPLAQFVNGVAGNDDGTDLDNSIIVEQLVAGVQYYLVTTGFGNSDFGAYAGTIVNLDPNVLGKATLGLVPEPASLAGVFGLLAMAHVRRLRRQVRS